MVASVLCLFWELPSALLLIFVTFFAVRVAHRMKMFGPGDTLNLRLGVDVVSWASSLITPATWMLTFDGHKKKTRSRKVIRDVNAHTLTIMIICHVGFTCSDVWWSHRVTSHVPPVVDTIM